MKSPNTNSPLENSMSVHLTSWTSQAFTSLFCFDHAEKFLTLKISFYISPSAHHWNLSLVPVSFTRLWFCLYSRRFSFWTCVELRRELIYYSVIFVRVNNFNPVSVALCSCRMETFPWLFSRRGNFHYISPSYANAVNVNVNCAMRPDTSRQRHYVVSGFRSANMSSAFRRIVCSVHFHCEP